MSGRIGVFPGIQVVLLFPVLLAVDTPSGRQNRSQEVFSAESSLVTEGRVFSVASDDFDGDGLVDLVVADYLHPARVLYNDDDRAFGRVLPVGSGDETATSGHSVALGDFNGDGHVDLFLVYNRFPARLLLGDGNGGFRDSGRAIGSPDLSGTSVAVADVDGDGDLDAFVTYYQAPARLYLNDGTGAFTTSEQTFFAGIALGDIDGDGDMDVVSLREEGSASIWINVGGRFALQDDTVGESGGIGHIALVDVDGDGDLDVVEGGRTTEGALWENDGGGGFRRTGQTFDPGTRIAAGDLDRDGDVDLVIGPSVWINTGGGRFAKVQTLPIAPTTALHLADCDGDGNLDLLAAILDRETGRADLRLFRNTHAR